MSGRINGATFHSWGEVPLDTSAPETCQKKRSKNTGGSQMYNKTLSLRWILADEISTAALSVLGILEKNLRKAKENTEGANKEDGTVRDWGGVNLIVAGDWLQLPAVCAKSIFRNPFLKDYEPIERRILDMFWHQNGAKPIPSRPELLFELSEQVQTRHRKDPPKIPKAKTTTSPKKTVRTPRL